MRLGMVLAIGLLLVPLAGCASRAGYRGPCVMLAPDSRPVELASALLFDPRPGPYDAQEFALRSDWPSTPSFYSPGELIFYRDRVVDFQGRPWNNWQGTYRRADSVRVGVGYRP